jgi:hypothetical protein
MIPQCGGTASDPAPHRRLDRRRPQGPLPGAQTIHMRLTGDVTSRRLVGVQTIGPIPTAVHKRIDTAAAAIFNGNTVDQINDLDLSYTPPLGSPWDALQAATQSWAPMPA